MLGSKTCFGSNLLLVSLLAPAAYSQSFSPGNLAVLRVGDGVEALVSSGNTLFVDQYTTAGALVNSVAVPDSGPSALLVSGAASSEGGLTRSWDRAGLVLAGYNTNRGSVVGSLASQSAAAVPRAVATIDAFATYHLAQASTTLYNSNNIRGAAFDGTNSYWTAGNPGGTYFVNPPQVPVAVQAGGGNTRQTKIIGSTLYFSTQAGTAGIYAFPGVGLPQTSATPVLLFATGANSQPAGFSLDSARTTAYVADQRAAAGGIQKWTNNASVWALAYSLATGAGAFDVAVDFSGPAPVIYATTAEASANRLVSIVDNGPGSIIRVLATAGASRIFRGLDFAPDLRPSITTQPVSQTVTNGSTVTFSVVAQSRYPLSYQWQKDGADLTGAIAATLTLQSVGSSDQGSYHVVVTNQYGTITSADASLMVNQGFLPPAITAQPVGQTVSLGGSATFTVSASGTAPLSYQWRFNNSDLAGQTNASLVLMNLGPAAQGNYLVRVSNPANSTNSQAAALTVLSPPPSFVGYTAANMIYVQTFDSLPNPGTTSVNAENPVAVGGTTYGLADPFDFSFPILPNSVDLTTGIGLGGLGVSNSMPGWYALGQIAAKFGASAGDQSTGGAISFGSTNSLSASTNRALGLLATSSTGPTAFYLKLINQTTGTLDQVTAHCTGELWRQAAVPKAITVSYWIDSTATNAFSTNATARLANLDVNFAPNAAATNPVPVDGTAPANQLSLGITNYAIADWPPGAALWLTWEMSDPGGKGQGLAIDDFSFSASVSQGTPPAQLVIALSGTNAVLSWPAALTSYQLQASLDPSQPNNWVAVTQTVTVNNGSNIVSAPIISTNQFYRLKR